jgi:cell division protein FtsB
MRELQHRQKLKRRLYSTPSLIIVAILTLLFVKGAVGLLGKEQQSNTDVEALQVKTSALLAQEETLNKNIAKLKTQSGISEQIKEKYNVSEAGEHVAVLVNESKNASGTATTTVHWYGKLWSAILSFI